MILSRYEIKYIYKFLDLDILNSFTETNKYYNGEVNKYIKLVLKNNINENYKKILYCKNNIIDNYELMFKLAEKKYLDIIKYLKYYNKEDKQLIILLNKHKDKYNIYNNKSILLLINYFCINKKKENIKKYAKYKLKKYLSTAISELNDSINCKLGINTKYINNIYFYINLYKNKKVYNKIDNNNYIYIRYSWKKIYDIIIKALYY